MTRLFLGISLLLSEEKIAFHLQAVFVLPNALRGSGHQNVLDYSVFECFFWGCVRPTLSGKYKQHFFFKQRWDGCKNRLQPFDPLSPHKECVVQSSFEIAFLLKHILPHYSLARLSQWRKDCLAHDQSQNFLGHQSLPLLCSPKVVTAGHQSAPGVLEWLPSCSTNILTRTDLGKMIIDPRPSFQTVWLNQKCWYPKNAQKDAECRRDVKGWLSG